MGPRSTPFAATSFRGGVRQRELAAAFSEAKRSDRTISVVRCSESAKSDQFSIASGETPVVLRARREDALVHQNAAEVIGAGLRQAAALQAPSSPRMP